MMADMKKPSMALKDQIRQWSEELGFQQTGFSGISLEQAEQRLMAWLDAGYHGDMHYMARHGQRRSRPQELVANTCSVISVSLDYLPQSNQASIDHLNQENYAYISRYALGRDYHKVLRKKLQALADRIDQVCTDFQYRVFTDSAPVLEKPLAEKAGLGWIGKHTNLINRKRGSWFFLGEIYTNLPLASDEPDADHCGSCRSCIDVCPTQAIIAPYQLDARLCISYLTIEFKGSIPVPLRKAIGNRIYGCDDCQLYCPWNRFAKLGAELDFTPRPALLEGNMIALFLWSEDEFLHHTSGTPIRRIGYECWLRNLAIGLGNAPTSDVLLQALQARFDHASPLVREHVLWAIEQHAPSG